MSRRGARSDTTFSGAQRWATLWPDTHRDFAVTIQGPVPQPDLAHGRGACQRVRCGRDAQECYGESISRIGRILGAGGNESDGGRGG